MRYSLILAIIGLFLTTTFSFAQETSPSTPSANAPRKALMEQRREALQNAKEEGTKTRAEIKEAFRQKLTSFKDKVKAERVSRINTILSGVNEKRTSAMLEHLDKMSEIITKLETHIQKLATDGKDTAAATQNVNEAKDAIASAKAVVEAQKVKDYTIVINSETTAKTDAATARENLHTDLKTAHDQVVAARKKVAEAISTTRSLVAEENNGQ